MKRLFVAVTLPIALRKRIYDELTSKMGNVKKVDEEKIHATLCFIGEVDEKDTLGVEKKLAEIQFQEFKVKIGKASHFNKRVFWVGAEGVELAVLAGKICSGQKQNNGFNGHITIARARESTNFLEEWSKINGKEINEEFLVDKFYLIESKLSQNGSAYTKIAEYKANKN